MTTSPRAAVAEVGMVRPKILVILHQENSSAGRVGQLLQADGFELDIRRPPLGDALPETLTGHAGAVVFGGPMSANDGDDFVRRETEWLRVPLSEDKPAFLGICLGAQMLVNHLGGKVDRPRRGDWWRSAGIRSLPPRTAKRCCSGRRWSTSFTARASRCPPGRDASGHRRDLPQSGVPLWQERLGHPVPCRADAGDDAALGGARCPPLRASRRPARRATISAAG